MSIIIKGGSSADLATVKPASTAPVATDTALVVTISPNSPAAAVNGTVSVSNFPSTQPVSGTVTSNIGTTNGLALDATLTGGNLVAVAKTLAKGTTIAGNPTSTAVDANTQALDVNLKGTSSVSVSNASLAVTGTFFQGTQPVSAASLPLPTGASTDATLATRLADATFTGRINTQGQKASAASTPVVLASDQSSIPVTGTFFQGTQPVSAASLPLPTGASADATLTGGTAKTQLVGGAIAKVLAASTAAVATDPALVVAISPNNTIKVSTAPDVTTTGSITTASAFGAITAGTLNSTATAAGTFVASPISGQGVAGITVSGTFTGSIAFEATGDGTNWFSVNAVISGPGTQVSVATVPGQYRVNSGGYQQVRARALSGATITTCNVTMNASADGTLITMAEPLPAGTNALGSVSVSNFPSTQPVSAASLPLPAGAATDASLTNGNARGSFKILDSAGANILAVNGSGQIAVSNFPTTQPVSGTVTSNIGTTNGLALDATLTAGSLIAIAKTSAKGTTAAGQPTSLAVDANTQALHVSVTGTPTVTVSNASLAVTGTFFQATQPVSAASLPLPTGAATDASLTNGNLRGSIKVLDAAGANALAVNASGQVAISNFPASQAVTGTFFQGTQPVSGTVTSNIGTTNGLALDATLTGGNSVSIVKTSAKGTTTVGNPTSLAVDANTQALHVAVTGTPTVTVSNASLAVTGTFFQGTQPVSAAALPLPAGAAADATLTGGTAKTQIIGGATAKVLAASTAAVATDPALVVAISPNSTVKVSAPPDTTTSGSITAASATGALTAGTLSSTVPAAGTFVATPVSGQGVVGITVTGTFTGSFAFEATGDGTNWFSVNAVISGPGTQLSAATVPGQYRVNSGGYQQVRVRAIAGSTITSCSVTLNASGDGTLITMAEPLPAGTNALGSVSVSNFPASQAVTGTFFQGTQPVSLASLPALATGANAIGTVSVTALPALATGANTIGIVNQGLAAAVAGAWTAKITDGTNTAAVTPAGALAITGPTANTVSIPSGNNPILIGGSNGGQAHFYNTDSSGNFYAVSASFVDSVLFASTITASGSNIRSQLGATEVTVFVNVKGTVSGTTPTLVVAIQNLDPSDGTTVQSSSQVIGPTITAAGIYSFNAVLRSGSYQATWTVSGTTPSFGNTTITVVTKTGTGQQGSPNTVANAWPTKLTDGTNTATVKAASTAAVATDTALVVAISPNNVVLTQDAADGSVAAGTAAAKSMLTGAQFNASPPGLTSGQQAALQSDVNGRLVITNQTADVTAAATVLAALNATVTLSASAVDGYSCTLTAVSAPTGIVLTPQISMDGGTSWNNTLFFDPTSQNAYATLDNTRPKAFAAGQAYRILTGLGVSGARVQVTSFTSGSVTISLRGNMGAPILAATRNQTSATYTAVYQLAALTSVALSTGSTSAADKQMAAIFHPATATRQVRIKRVTAYLESTTVATKVSVRLAYLTSATTPATGNPAITPTQHRPSAATAEATCLALPTTVGTLGGLINSYEFNMGVTTANTSSVTPVEIVLWDDSQGANMEPLIIRPGVAEGYSVQFGISGTSVTVLGGVKITFVEE